MVNPTIEMQKKRLQKQANTEMEVEEKSKTQSSLNQTNSENTTVIRREEIR